jgi:hypothetical protein
VIGIAACWAIAGCSEINDSMQAEVMAISPGGKCGVLRWSYGGCCLLGKLKDGERMETDRKGFHYQSRPSVMETGMQRPSCICRARGRNEER